jgi:hypothetical protein
VGDFGHGLTVEDLQHAPAGRAAKLVDDILSGRKFLTVAVER